MNVHPPSIVLGASTSWTAEAHSYDSQICRFEVMTHTFSYPFPVLSIVLKARPCNIVTDKRINYLRICSSTS